jgi:four helix bundle protein
MDTNQFPHTKLQVFHVAIELAVVTKRLADQIPRGHRSLADQILRASSSVVLNIGEGANRITSGTKRQRYAEARGECGEVAATVTRLVQRFS